MTWKRSVVALFAGCAVAGACATAGSTARDTRTAEDLPQQFVTEDGTMPVQECRSPLLDPRDNTRLRLMRSSSGGGYRGDYDVPAGKYGVGENELLRIDCETGQAIGIVKN